MKAKAIFSTYCYPLFFCLLLSNMALAQEEIQADPEEDRVDRITDRQTVFQQHAGLPAAASKIYFTDARFAVSGFGELLYNNYLGPRNYGSGDLELYNTNLYRFITYLAYKPRPWMVMYAELFAEFIHDGTREADWEVFTETFLDFLISENFNLRAGTSQLQIGFVNNNEEPVLFFSVNRPEVERIIIPSQWIDLGIMTYGQIVKDLNYSFSVYEGLDANNLHANTWIRGGRQHQFRGNWRSPVFNTQLEYHGISNTALSMSGIYTSVGRNDYVQLDNMEQRANAQTLLLSSYVRTEWKRLVLMALGSYGWMNNTERIFMLPHNQVLGSQVYGFYFEGGYDILPFFRGNRKENNDHGGGNFFFHPDQLKLPVFLRYERLNTHARVHPLLQDKNRFENNLHALVIGANFNTRHNIVFKTNYQFRWNKQLLPTGEREGNRLEFGFGFIF